jgi:RNA polymerase sigma factor (sigma-70 family)
MITQDIPTIHPERLSLNELMGYATREASEFLAQRQPDTRFALELFRRAIVNRDDGAWSCIYTLYSPLVLSWANQHRGATSVFEVEGSAALVNMTFAKFAQAITPTKWSTFDQLAAVLKYLKLTTYSVVSDEIRALHSRQQEDVLDTIEHEAAIDDPESEVIGHSSIERLWRIIEEELNSQEEKILMYLVYIEGMKPNEISRLYGRLFPSVEDVYRIKRNVLERLRRNRRLKQAVTASCCT